MTMQEDINRYDIYGLSDGKLIPLSIENVKQYNHFTHNLHHYIKKGDYARNFICDFILGKTQKLGQLKLWEAI